MEEIMEFNISIVILTKNGGNRVKELMKSIQNQRLQGSLEIVAVDSGSQDDTIKILKSFNAKIIRIKPEDFHHSKTRNLGAIKSKGDVLVYLTQDALPVHNDFLKKLLDPLKNKDVAVVYGRQIAYPDAKPIDKFFYSYFYPDERKILMKNLTENTRKFYMENIYVSDVCSAIKKEVWEQLKFSDNVPMSEDKDLALKVLKAGYNIVYDPKATVYHSHDYSLLSLFKRRFKDGAAFSNIALEGKENVLMRGLKFLTEEMKYLSNNKYIKWMPYALIYNFVYFIGFSLGKNNKYLPNFVKNPIINEN